MPALLRQALSRNGQTPLSSSLGSSLKGHLSIQGGDTVSLSRPAFRGVPGMSRLNRLWKQLKRYFTSFRPHSTLAKLNQMTPAQFKAMGNVKGVMFDLDDTLSVLNSRKVGDNVLNKLAELQKSGLQLAVISNNIRPGYCDSIRKQFKDRGLKVSFLENAQKPTKIGYKTMLEKMGLKPEEAVMVGDNLINDVWASQRVGMKAIRARWYLGQGWRNWKPVRWLWNVAEVIGAPFANLFQSKNKLKFSSPD